MATFFTIDRANALVPEVRELLLLLRTQRDELITLRDRALAIADGSDVGPSSPPPESEPAPGASEAEPGPLTSGPGPSTSGTGPHPAGLDERDLVRLRLKGIVDQMGASVARIDALGITLRDIGSGLIDFPALVGGRQVWLCWRLGEDDIAWWHELDTGFGGRQPLAELPAAAGRQ